VKCGVLQGPTTPPEERSWFWQYIRWRQNAPYNPKALDPITWGEYRKSGYLRILRTFHYSLQDRPEDKAPRIHAPMLVVRGQLDPIRHEDWAEEIADPGRGAHARVHRAGAARDRHEAVSRRGAAAKRGRRRKLKVPSRARGQRPDRRQRERRRRSRRLFSIASSSAGFAARAADGRSSPPGRRHAAGQRRALRDNRRGASRRCERRGETAGPMPQE
jgi:hypothetical protein